MKKLVMVGGVDPNTTLDIIDEEIIRITEKRNPRVLFIPTASEDDTEYCDRYKDIYEGKFRCKLDVLYLFNESHDENTIRDKIFKSDIIYIGGGSTEILMECFNKFNMKNILTEAVNSGIVIAGISAGAICLGMYYYDMKIECLGFLKFLILPHYNLENYINKYCTMTNEFELICIGLDNNCALEIIDNTYRIVTSKDTSNAYIIFKKDGHSVKRVIEKKSEFRPIEELIDCK
ncbi:Type 1 glutamine amidotransferase-like domain-containing protein [Sedimentibacter sp.]|uniref:Type 1 glutamine amidotransferase-like domain-containing protein n=1 Tax=Sedimentibacter sp. TaxID=1960295 RepID=UPI0028A00482|nr:Type 1 glutamine amidotransferase-like domain-containing protein [Sedimentibacter sp.]